MDWLNTPGEIATAIGGLTAILLFVRRVRVAACNAGSHLLDAFRIPSQFRGEFGDRPAKRIADAVRTVSCSQDLAQLKVEILHRHLGIGIFVCDPSGKCTEVNDQLCELFGLDSKEMVGFGWLSAVVEGDRMETHKAWAYAVKNDLPYRSEYTIRNARTHSELRVRARAWATKEGGVTLGYLGYVTPVED